MSNNKMTAAISYLPITNEDNTFLERTINGNFKIDLYKQNICDIALLKYGYGVKQDLIFKVFDDMQSLQREVELYNNNSKNMPLVIIFYNCDHWSTLMVCKSKNIAYYTDYYNTPIPINLENQSKFQGIDSKLLEDVKFKYYDSGIIALETAVTLFSNKENLPFDDTKGREIFKDILSCSSNIIGKRKNLANCLQILRIQKIKLNTLSNNLTEVTKKINNDKTDDFNYFNANVFLYFLETFALQDSRMDDIDPEYKTYLKNIINSEDIVFVANIRSKLLLHRKKVNEDFNLIEPNHLKLIINLSVNNLFQNILKYVNYILSIAQGKCIYNKKIDRPCEFLLNNKNTNVGDYVKQDQYNKVIDKHLILFLTKAFSSPSYSKDMLAHDEEQQCIFDLIVNFAPYFDNVFVKRKDILKELRNIQIHEFYRYNEERFAIEYALTNYLRENKNSLFKCCYSRIVYPLLQRLNEELKSKKKNKTNIGKTKTELCASLKNFAQEHGIVITQQQSYENQGTCVDSQNKIHQSNNVPQNDDINKIKEKVEDFFMLLLFIANEGIKDGTNSGTEDEAITRRYKYLKVEQILKIKTDLADLQRIHQSTQPGCKDDYETIKKSLQQQFTTNYGIMNEDFDSIVTLTINRNNIKIDDYDNFLKRISDHVITINKLQSEYKCSVKYISNMYRERRALTFSKGSLEEKICSLFSTNWEVQILLGSSSPQAKVSRQVNPDKFVVIIYEIISNASQKPIPNNINDVFNDNEFLNYLEKRDIFFPYLIKDLSLDFMIPLHANILSLPNNNIGDNNIRLYDPMIMKLVDKDDYIMHLKPIIRKFRDNKDQKAHFLDEILKNILKKYKNNGNFYFLNNILDDADIANDIVDLIRKKDDTITIKILEILVDKSFVIAFNDKEKALKLLSEKNINDAIDKLKTSTVTDKLYIYWKATYLTAHLNYKLGEIKECYQILENLTSKTTTLPEVKPYYFLSYSYMALIHNTKRLYQEAYKRYCALYNDFITYILEKPCPVEFNKIVYNDIVGRDRYKYAQSVDKRYLDVFRIKSDIAYSQFRINDQTKEEQHQKEALEIYESVHNVQHDVLGNSHKQIIITKRNIGDVSLSLGIKMSKNNNKEEALNYFDKALTYNREVFQLQKNLYWHSHPAVRKSFLSVLNTYKNLFEINRGHFEEYQNFLDNNITNIKAGSTVEEIIELNKIIFNISK